MTVFPVSLDGRGLPEYPNPQPDSGIATRLNASMVPALYLSAPSKRQIRPIGFGVIVFTVIITAYYVRRANSEFDELTDAISKAVLK